MGVAPDIEVDQDPARIRKGEDPQLEKAIDVALDLLAKNPTAEAGAACVPRLQASCAYGALVGTCAAAIPCAEHAMARARPRVPPARGRRRAR